ncbi:DUF1996 domain-containing protein [Actinomadura parmotrematis]|uniref:DUF1996 domain-containing protein n=1 Tax=Actinomadura parmotrematis TaxID=2864039 RepID=A0ABS7FKU3_9ACTN|nr:DUF1996 domain-containing protein [Actinomadura parmotrematis]MBW8480865.1 DUF1996 domain-containing protein [Actinomadura parmotrematis]
MVSKKGIATLVPALLLVAAAAEAPAASAMAARPSPAASPTPEATDGGMPGMDMPGSTDTPGTDDGATATAAPSATSSAGDGAQDPNQQNDQQDQNGQQDQGQQQTEPPPRQQTQPPQQPQQPQARQGPVQSDYVNIRNAPRKARARNGRNASTGSFTSRCGRNANGHNNPDNFIVAPGVSNGAHHIHDYVGNLSTDGFSTDQSLAAAGTTCARGDRSAYFWPTMRVRDQRDPSGQAAQSTADGNVGRPVIPAAATMRFLGNPRAKVTAMPRFLRVITGDAKAATNGTANARAQWTCSGAADRVFTDKYPLCPGGSRVTRVLEFPSCWDGRNTDSANHRTHVVFPAASGACPQGTRPVPRLQMTLAYNLPNRALAFAVDTFPEQGHAPVTDHADFENVMPDSLMRRAAACINAGRAC